MKTLYTAAATATSGRDGRVLSDDGAIDLALSVPRGMGGAGGTGTNPEQLFAAGYAACFGSAIQSVAARQKLNVRTSTTMARVSILKGDGGYRLAVALTTTFPALTRDQGMTLMEAAHALCPYSNATRGNIEVTLAVG